RLSSQDGFISYEKKLKTLLFLKMSKKRSAGGALTVSFISGGSQPDRGKERTALIIKNNNLCENSFY
ncbi:hypothetical protein, partial [Metabacillus idriensis]|uniref:hypothetical protein n=1 Tax=Metabacillus idriensis TaxID=324768 RepID=UPI001CD40F69